MGEEERIKELEELISKSKYNKRTQRAIGLYKAQLAKLKDKSAAKSSKKFKTEGYAIKKTGDATVALLGFPSVGKSTLLNAITDAKSKVADYEFTTLTVIPGMLDHKHAKIQIVDVPGIVHGAAAGTGRGKEVLSMVRAAEMIIVLIDVNRPQHYETILSEIYESGIRVNQKRPDVRIRKTAKDGIRIGSTVKLELTKETITDILKEFKITNADVLIRTKVDIDLLIDAIEGNRIYIPAITILNKIDTVDEGKLKELRKKLKPDLEISADKKIRLDELKDLIFKKLDLMRIYLKEVGKDADMKEPLIIKKGTTIEGACSKIHRDFINKFRFARVWGKSAKFPGQVFQLKHELKDEDVLEIHLI
ncbi:OBG GTPase family GTP-binding protein [Nanoarchaeota archaeon]